MKTREVLSRFAVATSVLGVLSIVVIEGGSSGCNVPFPNGEPLTGAALVKPVETEAHGWGSYRLNQARTELQVSILAFGFSSPLLAVEFRSGAQGENGDIVLNLTPFAGVSSGWLTDTEGNRIRREYDMQINWKTLEIANLLLPNALEELRAGRVYVVVRTEDHPDGELRGQVIIHE